MTSGLCWRASSRADSAVRAGFHSYLTKPVRIEDVLGAIEDALEDAT